jgi:hypothetical protein
MVLLGSVLYRRLELMNSAALAALVLLICLAMLQQQLISFLAGTPHGSYRIPGPPAWLQALFFEA